MFIKTKTIYNQMPTEEQFSELFDNPRKRKIGKKIIDRIYYRTRLAEAQNWRCCYCGIECSDNPTEPNSVTLEHVIPFSDSQDDSYENCVVACASCNSKRGNMPTDKFMAATYTAVFGGAQRVMNKDWQSMIKIQKLKLRYDTYMSNGRMGTELNTAAWVKSLDLAPDEAEKLITLITVDYGI